MVPHLGLSFAGQSCCKRADYSIAFPAAEVPAVVAVNR